MTTPVIFTDLDDTLFANKESYPDIDLSLLKSCSKEGQFSQSYMCDRRQALMTWIEAGADVIPATARDLPGYLNVTMPFHHGAIIANGAIILNADNTQDKAWDFIMQPKLQLSKEALDIVENALRVFDPTGEQFQIDRYFAGDKAYGMTAKFLKLDKPQQEIEDELEEDLRNKGVWEHVKQSWVNEYLGFMPNGIGKKYAVEYLLRTRHDFHGRPTIGMGDASTDLGFMSLCDMMVIPQNTRNAAKLLS